MDGMSEIDALVVSTRTMMMTTKQAENSLDNMLNRAHRVAARIAAMNKYERILQDMQDLTVNGTRRKLILSDLQRENRQIMALQDENRQLRETTEEYLRTMRDILESHADLETGILMQKSNNEYDDIDNIIFELANNQLEVSLKQKATKLQEIMDDLEKMRKNENQELVLAVQQNKNYKELFKLASLSCPSASAVLQKAIKMLAEPEIDEDKDEEKEEDDVVTDPLNQTVLHNATPDLNNTIVRNI